MLPVGRLDGGSHQRGAGPLPRPWGKNALCSPNSSQGHRGLSTSRQVAACSVQPAAACPRVQRPGTAERRCGGPSCREGGREDRPREFRPGQTDTGVRGVRGMTAHFLPPIHPPQQNVDPVARLTLRLCRRETEDARHTMQCLPPDTRFPTAATHSHPHPSTRLASRTPSAHPGSHLRIVHPDLVLLLLGAWVHCLFCASESSSLSSSTPPPPAEKLVQ